MGNLCSRKKLDELLEQVQSLSPDEKVDGLELIGSTYILSKNYFSGLNCWLEASQLRTGPKNCQKFQIEDLPLHPLFLQREWATRNDLRQLEPCIYDENRLVDLVYQAMLVRLRLLGRKDEDHVGILSQYAYDYFHYRDCTSFINASLLCLDWVKIHGGYFTTNFCLLLRRLLYKMTTMSSPQNLNHNLKNFSTKFAALNSLVTALKRLKMEHEIGDPSKFSWLLDNYLGLVVQLFVLLSAMQKSAEEEHKFKKCLHELVMLNVRNSEGLDLLLLACRSKSCFYDWYVMKPLGPPPPPSARVVELLLEVGADPNSADDCGNTALHFLAEEGMLTHESSIIRLLLCRGAHWDRNNRNGCRPFDLVSIPSRPVSEGVLEQAGSMNEARLWLNRGARLRRDRLRRINRRLSGRRSQDLVSIPSKPVSKGQHFVMIPKVFTNCVTLKCFAAKTLRQYYSNDKLVCAENLPKDLTQFVLEH